MAKSVIGSSTAHGQLGVFAGDAVVTVTAHDHGNADAVAAFVGERRRVLSVLPA